MSETRRVRRARNKEARRLANQSTPADQTPEPYIMHLLVAIVNGDVQGRSVRMSTLSEARALGNITGCAMNRGDGSVEMRFFGPEHELGILLEELKCMPGTNKNLVQPLPIQPVPDTIVVPEDLWQE